VLLVADGVGGWAESGVDPALYSKRLAKIIEELVQKDSLKYIENPKALVKEAVSLNKETGSTTVCLLTLHP
jgi:protein phosphatase PTC7